MRTFGLLGYPLSHSFSQKYFAEKFRLENIADCEYLNFPIENISELHSLLLKYPHLKGLNVTIPHKESVIRYLDDMDLDAKRIEAVNTIKILKNGNKTILKGYNTDFYGFWKAIEPLINVNHKKALILGTGGASKAVAYAFRTNGIECKYVSRTPKNTDTFSYQELTRELVESYPVIVNSSPLGTYPKVDEFPDIPYHFLTSKNLLYDLVYNPPETSFMKQGKEFSAVTSNGLSMLHFQAEKAWEIWNSD
jgi:shikimate dehydrogenase